MSQVTDLITFSSSDSIKYYLSNHPQLKNPAFIDTKLIEVSSNHFAHRILQPTQIKNEVYFLVKHNPLIFNLHLKGRFKLAFSELQKRIIEKITSVLIDCGLNNPISEHTPSHDIPLRHFQFMPEKFLRKVLMENFAISFSNADIYQAECKMANYITKNLGGQYTDPEHLHLLSKQLSSLGLDSLFEKPIYTLYEMHQLQKDLSRRLMLSLNNCILKPKL